MKAHLAAVAAVAALAASSPASAAGNTKGFGDKHQFILSADRLVPLFGYSRASVTTTTPNGVDLVDAQSGWSLSLLATRDPALTNVVNVHTLPRVGIDFTIIPKLTIGGAIAFGFGLDGTNKSDVLNGNQVTTNNSDAPTSTAFGIAPRVGYIIPLGETLAFWPRAGLGIYSVSATSKRDDTNNGVTTTTTTSITDTLFSLDLDPELVIVPVEHFFINFGLLINVPLGGSRSTESTVGAVSHSVDTDLALFHVGLTAGIGGYFDL